MYILLIILFLILTVAVLFGANWFLYFSIVNFFNIGEELEKVLLITLFILAISFFVSTLLSQPKKITTAILRLPIIPPGFRKRYIWSENFIIRTLYLLAGVWLGILNNFVLAAALIWLIILFGKLFKLSMDPIILAPPLFIVALALSIYAIWNALNPRLKSISVSIPKLPNQWKNKKIVQISDVHLGQINQKEFIDKIVEKINLVNPEMVLITGDLFDGMDGILNSVLQPFKKLNPPKGTYFVTGNHETYLGLKNIFQEIKKTPIKVIRNEVISISGLKIIGIDYPEQGEKSNIIEKLESLKKNYFGKPNILLHHTPTNIPQIKKMGINLELCGHTHNGQIFPFNLITKLVYRNYNYGLYSSGNFTLYTTNGVGTWGPTMRLGNIPEIVVITLN